MEKRGARCLAFFLRACLERVYELQSCETSKIAIKAVNGGAVFDSKSGQMSVGRVLRPDVRLQKQPLKNAPVPLTSIQYAHLGARQPIDHNLASLVHFERVA